MIDSAASFDTRRANEARADLIGDISKIKEMGGKMIDKTETVIHKAPLLLGLGVAALIGVAVLAGRRSQRSPFKFPSRQRSFLAEAVRGVALSALGVLSARVTQRLLTAADSSEPVRHA